MSGTAREEKLLFAIGGIPEELVEESMDPRASLRRKPSLGRWAAMAASILVVACAGLFGLLPRMGGSSAGGLGISNSSAAPADPGTAPSFMSYAGPVLPLTVLDGPEGLPAEREVTWDFKLTVDASRHSIYRVEVTDETTITNPGEKELTFTVAYPVTADLQAEEELLPTLTVNGERLESARLWGSGGSLWDTRLNGWQDCKDLLEDGSCLALATEAAPALEQQVTVWEFLDETAPEWDTGRMAPTVAVSFRLDREKTTVFPWGFNGFSSWEDGTVQYDFFVRGDREPSQRRLLIFLGEVPAEYTMGGYENGACEKPLAGVSAKVTAFTTSLGELLDRLSAEEFLRWNSAEGLEGRTEAFRTLVRRTMERFTSGLPEEGGYFMLEDVFSHVLTTTRVMWTTGKVTIPAGQTVTVTARYRKEPSFDFACAGTGREGLLGWEMGTRLGSSLSFRRIAARLENAGRVLLEGQNFGFDPKNGVTRVELDPETERYYMEVRLAEEG